MNEQIKLLLSLSISGSILALILLSAKPLIKHRLSKLVQYYIWIIVLLRLIVPFSFENSIMNNVFYSNEETTISTNESSVITTKLIDDFNEESFNTTSIVKQNIQNNVEKLNNNKNKHSMNYKDIFNKYGIHLWLLGVIIFLIVNISGYFRFLKHLKKGYKPAKESEIYLLNTLIKKRKNIRLLRNSLLNTPMLIGVFRPCIIIPDVNLDDVQLKNILIHEITHQRHYDVGIKWLTMVVTSIHWFNPVMYFIKKEINNACELACDEGVIKHLTNKEKQDYGDTLISFAQEQSYSIGVLQATMIEEKNSLKERLVSIMKYNKKSDLVVISSVILVGSLFLGALFLGGGNTVNKGQKDNNSLYSSNIDSEDLLKISKYRTPYVGESSKVRQIASSLPLPNSYFKQQYISMETKEKPYGLTIYYEPGSSEEHISVWPITKTDSDIETNSKLNAIIVFAMIENVDKVTFAFKDTQSEGELDESEYNTEFTYLRSLLEEEYGKLYNIGKDVNVLMDIIEVKTDIENSNELDIDFIESNLESIMSSPLLSSNPGDYIDEHQKEYETIIKYNYEYGNDEVLKYLLYQFEKSNVEGLRGHIIMLLSKDMLGPRDNVTDKYLSPVEWYEKLELKEEIILPDYTYDGNDLIEKLVYETELERNKVGVEGFTIVAPHIFGSYEDGNKLKVFVTTFSTKYRLYDNILHEVGGGVIPSAITYVKNSDGSYSLEEYTQAKDGSYFASSIEEFCTMPVSGKKINGLFNEIINHYMDYEDIVQLERENLIKHLEKNNQKEILLKEVYYNSSPKLIPLT